MRTGIVVGIVLMRMMRATAILCAVFLTPGAVQAADSVGAEPASGQRILYLGGGVLRSRLAPDTGDVAGVSVDDRTDTGMSLTLGYTLFPQLSVEGHIADLGAAALTPSGSVDYLVGGISAIVYGVHNPPFRSSRHGFSLFGRLGLGFLDNDADVPLDRVNSVHALLGLGVEYGFSDTLGMRAELVSHDTDARYGGIGVLYRFGSGMGARWSADGAPVRAPVRPAQVSGPVAAEGIVRDPVDADADGVPDLRDDCTQTRSARLVDDTGCAVIDPAGPGIAFQFDSDILTRPAADELDKVVATLVDNAGLRVAIEAHTDNMGNAMSNLQLSSMRAITVAGYLVQRGVDPLRLQARAFGEALPRVANATAEGRARNRRVEFKVIE